MAQMVGLPVPVEPEREMLSADRATSSFNLRYGVT
jgi:hypothetical protein